jgi:hypothetical protein
MVSGAILISGANSPASLSQVTMRRQVQDDLSKWEMNSALAMAKAEAPESRTSTAYARAELVAAQLAEAGIEFARELKRTWRRPSFALQQRSKACGPNCAA